MNDTEKTEPTPTPVGAVELPAKMTVGELGEVLGKSHTEMVKELMRMGHMLSINEEIELSIAMQLAQRLQIPIKRVTEDASSTVASKPRNLHSADETLQEKIPVVTVVGHVDHGKTTLLDAIRETEVAEREAGGITQSIGAYQVERNGKPITFIDTPGHAVFTAMRANGIQVTDIALLMVAADDGVMPQTVEAISHIKAAKVPLIVVINKTDVDNADPERVKFQLAEHDVNVEDIGGDVQVVSISARSKQGVDDLLEALDLLVEVEELKANPDRPGVGVVVESTVERTKGTLTTVLLHTGTLKQGDTVVIGQNHGRVRAIFDTHGKTIKSVAPGVPAQLLGISGVAELGQPVEVVESDATARELTKVRKNVQIRRGSTRRASTVEDMRRSKMMSEGDTNRLNVVVKGDTHGSTSAVCRTLETHQSKEVGVHILHAATGAVNESDITLASASGGIVLAFNTKQEPGAKKQAAKLGVTVRDYDVIYRLIEDVEENFKQMFEPIEREELTATAVVLQVFPFGKNGKIAGIRVNSGTLRNDAKIVLKRGEEQIHTGEIATMRRIRTVVEELEQGLEGGLTFSQFKDFEEDDVIEAYEMRTA